MDKNAIILFWIVQLGSACCFIVTKDENRRSDAIRSKREATTTISASDRLSNLLRQARTDDGNVDLNALLAKNIRDPVPLADFNISSNGLFSNINGRFTNLHLHGLKGFNVDKITMNLSKMNLSAVMSIPILSVVGDYFLDGSLTFFSLSGEGGFWMNLSSIELRGFSIIQTTSEGKLSMGEINLESEVGEIQLHFENLMGGGAWGSISNSILNQLSELILGELKPSLLRELSDFLRYQFNDVLFEKLPKDFMNPEMSNIIDSILSHSTVFMVNNGMEPLKLPDHREAFERRLFFVTTRGDLSIYNGSLHGLSTLYRKGDVVTVFANNSIIFEADFGFENLTGGYSWQAQLFGRGPRGLLDIKLKSTEGFVKIKQDLRSGSRLELVTLRINDIRHIWFDIQGLGTWDYVTEAVVNLITNGLKMQLADTMAVSLKRSVQKELDSLNIAIPS